MRTASELGKAVRGYRDTMGINQTEFGKLAGISRGAVSLIERGRGNPRMNTLARIEAVLEVVIQEVIEDGIAKAWYVRDAWVDPDLFCRIARRYVGGFLFSVLDVKHCYMRLMPNKGQPYLLKNSLERGWWKATIIEAPTVAGRIMAQKRVNPHDWLVHVPVS